MKFIFIIFTLICSLFLTFASDQLFYCADFSCQEPISTGKTLLRYSAKTDKHLSFPKNGDIKVLSKPVSGKGDWIGYYNGKVGLVPEGMVREMRMHKYDSQFKYPFEHLPVWGPQVNVKELSENYVEAETDDKASNAPPILDIDPGTKPPEDAEQKTSEAVANSANIAKNEEPEQSSKNKDAEASLDSPSEKSVSGGAEPENQELPASVSVSGEKPAPPKQPRMADLPPAESLTAETEAMPPQNIEEKKLEEPITESKPVETKETPDSVPENDVQAPMVAEAEKENKEELKHQTEDEEVPKDEITESKDETQEAKPDISEVNEVIEQSKVDEPAEEPQETEPKETKDPVEEPVEEAAEDDTPEIESTTSSIFSAVKGLTSSVMNLLPEDLRDDEPPSGFAAADQVPSQPLQDAQEVPQREQITTPMPEDNIAVTAEPDAAETPGKGQAEDNVENVQAPPEIPSPTLPPQDLVDELTAEDTTARKPAETLHFTVPATPNPRDTPQTLEAVSKPEELPQSVETKLEEPEVPATVVPTVIPIEIPAIEQPEEPKEDLHLTASPAPSESPAPESTPLPEPASFQAVTETTQPAEIVPEEVSVTPKPELAIETVADAVPEVTEIPAVTEVPHEPEIPEPAPTEQSPEPEIPEPAPTQQPPEPTTHDDNDRDHSHHHHHHHHHHRHEELKDDSSAWSIIVVVKHLSATLMSFLPEHLQDSILDVDSALVFTGIIALMLVSICVPYFLIESILAVRPLKKQVVELNKSLWKVSAAYENQQEEFDTYKKKALAYDEDQKRIEQLEMELQIVKKLEAKQKEQVKRLQKQLKTSAKAADGIENLVEASMKEKEIAMEERNRLQISYTALQATLKEKLEELENAQASGSALALDLEVVHHEKDNLAKRLATLETELELVKNKLASESEVKRAKVEESDALTKERDTIQAELLDLRRILHQYEENVSAITDELTAKENELQALKETLGDDSPLIDISETKAKLKSAEEEAASLKSRCETVAFENASLTKSLEETKAELEVVKVKKEEAENNLKVLEGYFRHKEEELRTAVAKLEVEQQIKHKDKDDLVKMIREKESEIQMLISTNEGLKQEIEDMKGAHKMDLRKLESKADEHWLSLCQTERKYAEARKECELLRQKLVALAKEKDGGDDDRMSAIGDVPLFSLPPEMVPPPPLDDLAPPLSYFPLDDDFNPPPPLPLGSEPMRPPPLGRLSPTSPNNNYSSYLEDDDPISPIGRGSVGGRGDYSEDSSGSDTPDHRRPGSRDNWMNDNRSNDRHPPNRRRRGHGNPKTSSPLPHGVNC